MRLNLRKLEVVPVIGSRDEPVLLPCFLYLLECLHCLFVLLMLVVQHAYIVPGCVIFARHHCLLEGFQSLEGLVVLSCPDP